MEIRKDYYNFAMREKSFLHGDSNNPGYKGNFKFRQ